MSTIKVSVWYVDDGFEDFDIPPEKYDRLRSLMSRGFKGKELVDTWHGEASGAPYKKLTVIGEKPDGDRVNIKIDCT